jgi:CubicO group peptidase (beta-lactamase class C family)
MPQTLTVPFRRAWMALAAMIALACVMSTIGGPAVLPVRAAEAGARAPQERIDAYVQERMSAWSVPGLSLAIVEDGKVATTRGYGLANREQATPMTPQTLVAVGSTTKSVTALAILQLVEQGKVDLDAPVTRYLPWFALDDPRSGEITVRHLLTHTAGIPANAALDGSQAPDALERRVRALEWEPMRSAPGTRWEYANDGFNTAGLIVQAVSGMPYERYVEERIAKPLGMARTTFDPARAAQLGMAQGYVKRRGALQPAQTRFTRGYNPTGMLLSDAEDAGRYLAALLGGGAFAGARVLTPESVQRLWTPAADVSDGLTYGLGWFLRTDEGLRVAFHPGEILTMGSTFVLVPERKLGVAALANIDNDAKDEIAEGVTRLLLGFEPVLRPVPQTGAANTFVPDRSVWDRYVGEYETPQGVLRLARDGDKLVGTISGFALELEPVSDTRFIIHTEIASVDETEIELRIEPDGSVSLYVKGQRFGVKR